MLEKGVGRFSTTTIGFERPTRRHFEKSPPCGSLHLIEGHYSEVIKESRDKTMSAL